MSKNGIFYTKNCKLLIDELDESKFMLFTFKLPSYGHPVLFPLLSPFLNNRSIRVLLVGCTSETFTINAGVPQGSVLGPTLLLLNINDMLNLTSKKYIHLLIKWQIPETTLALPLEKILIWFLTGIREIRLNSFHTRLLQ